MIGDFKRAVDLLCDKEGLSDYTCEVSISFESEEGIRELNAKYRDKDTVTDVLSFPMYDSKKELIEGFEDAEFMDENLIVSLGDVVICTEVAKNQAKEYGHSEQRELVYLFVHSMLHLLGYDHEDDDERAKMRKSEESIMHELMLER